MLESDEGQPKSWNPFDNAKNNKAILQKHDIVGQSGKMILVSVNLYHKLIFPSVIGTAVAQLVSTLPSKLVESPQFDSKRLQRLFRLSTDMFISSIEYPYNGALTEEMDKEHTADFHCQIYKLRNYQC